MHAMCDGAGQESSSYDALGRVLTDRRTTNSVTKDFTYAYNFDSSLASLTYPTGRIITYAYSAAARALSAVDSANSINYALNASYAPQGALSSLQNGTNIVSTFYYNNRLQPCRISVKSSGTAPSDCTSATTGNVLDFTYGFNLGTANNGNVASIANNRNTNRSQSFTYDELNRIKTAQTQATTGGDAWGLAFGYDVWANLLSSAVTQGSAPMLSVTATTNNQIAGLCYDSAGNLAMNTPCPQPPGTPFTPTYNYDAENRMTVTAGVTYTYDGDGKRIKKSNGKLYWYGSGSDPLEETDLSGTPSADYIFFNGKRTARLDLPGAVVHYYFANHLGSASVVTSSTGTIQDESDFYPFGGERTIIDADPNQYKFTGKERDSESGLDFFIARYYSSQYGRFLTPDWAAAPIAVPYADFGDPQSLNLYTYVGNNPVTRFDIDGHCWPASECVTKFQNAVSEAAQKITDAAANTGGAGFAQTASAVVGTGKDLVNGTADMFRAGEAVGACIDNCNGTQMAEAVGQDLNRTAGLVATAALAVGTGETIAARMKPGATPEPVAPNGTANIEPHPSVTKPYQRPSGATTPEQRAAVQGKPCVDCGQTTPKQFANHKEPLVKEYYRTGTIDRTRMRSVDSVNSHCPTCSAKSGAELSTYSKTMKKDVEGP